MDLTKVAPEPRSISKIFWRDFPVFLANPKTLLFYGAFLPRFVVPHVHQGAQLVLLSMTFLVLALLLDSCWPLLAARFRACSRRMGGHATG